MPEHPAVNASPLIFLSRAGLLDMLKLEGEEIVIPKPVVEEIRRRGAGDLTVQAIEGFKGFSQFFLRRCHKIGPIIRF